MVEFINGGKMGGGLTNAELERLNVRQATRRNDTTGLPDVKNNERNTQATNDDVFKLAEGDIELYRGRGDEPELARHEMIYDPEREVKVNVEGVESKLEALHKNVHQTREEVGRGDAHDHRNQVVDAGFFTKNYQAPSDQAYGESVAPPAFEREEPASEPLPPNPEPEFNAFDDPAIDELRAQLERFLDPRVNAQESALEANLELRKELEELLQ
jgi:hypothetical protein